MFRTLFLIASLLGSVSATKLAAQDIKFDIFHTRDCVARAVELMDRQLCIGQSTSACISATPMGGSTLGMSDCTQRELSWWDARLNHFYQKLRALEKQEDADLGDLPGYEKQAVALRDMQRAWIAFRDGKCFYERAQWTGGTGGGPAWVGCMMYETAMQAMYLEIQAAHY